jgi:hypothetical protein
MKVAYVSRRGIQQIVGRERRELNYKDEGGRVPSLSN